MKIERTNFDQAYAQWVNEEKSLSEKEFSAFSVQFSDKLKARKLTILRTGIAAALVLALFSTVALKTQFFSEPLLRPHYTPEQIKDSYDNTMKVLAVYSKTIKKEMEKLRDLDRFSQSLDQLKVFKNAVPEIENRESKIDNR